MAVVVQHADKTDVVITRVAALTPIGFGFEEMKRGLRRSESRIGALTLFADEPAARGIMGAELPSFDAKQILGKKGLRNKDRNTLIILSALQLDLGEQISAIGDPKDIGLTVGTTFGSLSSQISFTETYLRDGFRAVNAMEFPNMVINSPPSHGNIWFDLAASSTTISNGFTAGLDAVIFSADQIHARRASAVLAGGSDELSLHIALSFRRMGLASPTGRVRPFDESRDGTLLGEGAALVLLESREHAEKRGAPIIAEVLGYGCTFDGSIEFGFNPAADGASRAMELALARAGLRPTDVDVIAASASGSPAGDRMEADAIERVFGDHAFEMPIVAYNSYWGQCYSATGALQLAAALADLSDGVVSATCGFERADLGQTARGLRVTQKPVTGLSFKTVMVNAFGYSGQNSSVIIRRP